LQLEILCLARQIDRLKTQSMPLKVNVLVKTSTHLRVQEHSLALPPTIQQRLFLGAQVGIELVLAPTEN